MGLTFAGTWNPRGEQERLQRLYPQLKQIYDVLIVSVPKTIAQEDRMLLQNQLGITVVETPRPGWGRYLSLAAALETGAEHIHYCDVDRLLHWVETRAAEWRSTIQRIRQTDHLIIGRTEQAFHSHPQALVQTERIINAVASSHLGQVVDVGGGSRGLSKTAAQFIVDHTSGGSWGDVQWPLLLHQAGFPVDYVAVDGLAWETPDRYQNQTASPNQRIQAAERYDQEAQNWAKRTQIALAIIQEGLNVT